MGIVTRSIKLSGDTIETVIITDIVSGETTLGTSDEKLVTEKAIKNYVDNNAGGGTGETSLSTAISTESSIRASADSSLSTAISGGDSSLTTAISTETSSRISADSSLSTSISTNSSNINNKENTITAGTTAQYWSGDKSWQTLNTGVVPESGNEYHTTARARGSVSGTGVISYNSSTGVFSHTDSTTVRHVTDTEKNTWNNKSDTDTVTSIRRDNTGTYRTGNINLIGGTNVSISEGSTGQFTFTATNTNTTYSAGNGITLSTTTFSVAGGTGLTQESGGLRLTGDSFSATSTYASLRAQATTAGDVGLGSVTNESKSTMFSNPTFTGTVTAGHIAYNVSIDTKNANYTVAAADNGKVIEFTGTRTVTLPNSLATGFQVTIVNYGTGTITINASTTLRSKDSNNKLTDQYAGATAYHRGSNVWVLMGDLTT